MVENKNIDTEMIRGMVEDFWRSWLPVCSQNMTAAMSISHRFEERIAATASLMPMEKANAFLIAIDKERGDLLDEYERSPEALKRRLNISENQSQHFSEYHRQGIGEMAVRTAIRATIWETIISLFRR